MFNGSFTGIQNSYSEDVLRKRITEFMPKLCEYFPFDHSTDVLGSLEGIQFLPVDKNKYLSVQSFVNCVESLFPGIRYTAVICRSQLIWSGMQQDDIKILYFYLTKFLLPSLQTSNSEMSLVPANKNVKQGWIIGPVLPSNANSNFLSKPNIPTVYLVDDKPYNLLIYCVKDVLVTFLTEQDDVTEQIEYPTGIAKFVANQIEGLPEALSEPERKPV